VAILVLYDERMTNRSVQIAVLLCFLGFSKGVLAGEPALDPGSTEAIAKTQALLADPVARAAALKDPNAAAADRNLKALGLSPADQEKAYRISGEILEKWVKETGGDAAKLQNKLQETQRDPSSFSGELTPAQAEAIHHMGAGIAGKNSTPN
jgi:hypothetical protein